MNKSVIVFLVDSKGNVFVNKKDEVKEELVKNNVSWDKFKEIFGDLEKGCYV